MPYILKYDRTKFKIIEDELNKNIINNSGELNYIITSICLNYLKHNGLKYENLNNVEGVLKCVADEIYRRITGPYEDIKIEQNDDLELYDEPIKDL